jgi:hypothetical protein
MLPLQPFCLADGDHSQLPGDVLQALGQPPSAKTGCLVVFTTTAVAAWRRLHTLGLAPESPLAIRPFRNPMIDVLDRPEWRSENMVFALPSSGCGTRVVQIIQTDRPCTPRDLLYLGDVIDGRLVEAHDDEARLTLGPRITSAALRVADLWASPIFPHSTPDRVRAAIQDWPELRAALDDLVVEIYDADPAQVALTRIHQQRAR